MPHLSHPNMPRRNAHMRRTPRARTPNGAKWKPSPNDGEHGAWRVNGQHPWKGFIRGGPAFVPKRLPSCRVSEMAGVSPRGIFPSHGARATSRPEVLCEEQATRWDAMRSLLVLAAAVCSEHWDMARPKNLRWAFGQLPVLRA